MNKNINDIYRQLVSGVSKAKKFPITAKEYGIEDEIFKRVIDEIERDGLFERGAWCIPVGYIFRGLTYSGQSFIENNDSKEYHKIEKTEINYENTINISGDNLGIAVSGNQNIINSEFDEKFLDLISLIKDSKINNKDSIIDELVDNKGNKNNLQLSLSKLLGKGAEVSSIVGAIAGVISLL